MDDEQEQDALKRVEEKIIRIFGEDYRQPTAGQSTSGLSPDEFRRRTVFTIVNVLLTAPDIPRHLLKTREARVRHLSVRLRLSQDDAELLHDAFEASARMQPMDYPDIAMLIETAKRMVAEGENNVEATVGAIMRNSTTRH